MRAGNNYLCRLDLRKFCEMHSWGETGRAFVGSSITSHSR
jgi:hypothetical protein